VAPATDWKKGLDKHALAPTAVVATVVVVPGVLIVGDVV
jgi:hypothetical protein